MSDTYLVRVTGPNFVASLVFNGRGAGRITRTAPILHKMHGMSADEARAHIRQRGWTATVVTDTAAVAAD